MIGELEMSIGALIRQTRLQCAAGVCRDDKSSAAEQVLTELTLLKDFGIIITLKKKEHVMRNIYIFELKDRDLLFFLKQLHCIQYIGVQGNKNAFFLLIICLFECGIRINCGVIIQLRLIFDVMPH